MSVRQVAQVSRLHRGTLLAIAAGTQERITQRTEERILAVAVLDPGEHPARQCDDADERHLVAVRLGKLDQSWRDRRACRHHPWEIFYEASRVADALAVCARCTVRQDCLAEGLAEGETQNGVWGGTTPAERRQLLEQRGRTAS